MRASLRVALNTLPEAVASHLIIARDRVAFDSALPYWLDVAHFEADIGLYRGDLLQDFAVADAPEFELWVEQQRESLRQRALYRLETLLGQTVKGGDWLMVTAHAHQTLTIEPVNEAAYRALMITLAQQGQRSQALAQFERCRRLLLALYEEIKQHTEERKSEGQETDDRAAGRQEAAKSKKEDKQKTIRNEEVDFGTRHAGTSGGQMATNILFPLTSFVGRVEDLDQLWELLLLPQPRIITIVGAGGMGKTRLALELARLLHETPPELSSGNPHFPGGLWWVDLSALPVRSPPGRIIQEIAAVFALTVEADASLLDAVAALLADRACLLLLDNCEHVVTACAAVVQQLALRCPYSKIIATSREALRVPGEQLFPLTPLSVLHGRRNRQQPVSPPDQIDQLRQAGAVRLFIERAQLLAADFALTDEQLWSIAQICHWVDGLPLAIELAAARVRLLSPAAMLQQLGQGRTVSALLGQGPRTAPPRLLTIYNTIDWSYRLLESATEQALFQQMAVFAGGARLEEIQAICEETWRSPAAHANLLATLDALLEKNLLTGQDHQGVRRYGMLLTIQEYAVERLTEAGAADRSRARHLAVYTQLAEHGDAHLSGAQQLFWLDQLEAEQENFRAALIWALGEAGQLGHDPKGGMALLTALCDFWSVRGYWAEGQQWAERTLQWLHADLAAYPLALQARVYLTAGLLYGNTAAPLPWLQRALALYRAEGNQKAVAVALRWLLHIHLALRDWEATAAVADELTPFAEAFTHPILLLALGRAAFVRGDEQGAQRYFQHGELAASQQGHLLGWVYAICLQGMLAATTGEGGRLEGPLQQALEQARQLGRKDLQMHLCHTLSELALGRHAYGAALTLIREGLPLARQLGHQTAVATFLCHCASVAARIEPSQRTASALMTTAHHLLQQRPHLAELMVEMAYQRAAAQAQLVSDAFSEKALTTTMKPLTLDEALTYAGQLQQRLHVTTKPPPPTLPLVRGGTVPPLTRGRVGGG